MNKQLLLGTAAVFLLTSGGLVRAADLPVKTLMAPAPVLTWTGFYVGGSAGAALLQSESDYADVVQWDGGTPGNVRKTSKVGGALGAQVGYNWQHRNFVIGAEGDASWLFGLGQTKNVAYDSEGATLTNGATGFASIRARVGYDLSGTLVYGTAGIGWVKNDHNFNVTCCSNPPKGGNFSASKWQPAFVVGAGVEHMIDAHWSVRGEALAAFTDTHQAGPTDTTYFSASPRVPAPTVSYNSTLVIGRLGVNYRF
jgi:outer membrane immunogenic protein